MHPSMTEWPVLQAKLYAVGLNADRLQAQITSLSVSRGLSMDELVDELVRRRELAGSVASVRVEMVPRIDLGSRAPVPPGHGKRAQRRRAKGW